MLSLLLLICKVVFALSIFLGCMWHLANCVVINWKGLWLCVNAYLSNSGVERTEKALTNE